MIICTINAIEKLYSKIRKAVPGLRVLSSDKAAGKLIYRVMQKVEAKWIRPPINWHQAEFQIAINFQDKIRVTD